jgi:hypothetical protein
VLDGTPLWLRLVLRAERMVGTRVESAVHSGTYFDLVTHANRGAARLTGAVEGVSSRVLHLANLPAGSDMRRVREQLARMERRIVQLSKQVEEQAAPRQPEPEAAQTEVTKHAARAGSH